MIYREIKEDLKEGLLDNDVLDNLLFLVEADIEEEEMSLELFDMILEYLYMKKDMRRFL